MRRRLTRAHGPILWPLVCRVALSVHTKVPHARPGAAEPRFAVEDDREAPVRGQPAASGRHTEQLDHSWLPEALTRRSTTKRSVEDEPTQHTICTMARGRLRLPDTATPPKGDGYPTSPLVFCLQVRALSAALQHRHGDRMQNERQHNYTNANAAPLAIYPPLSSPSPSAHVTCRRTVYQAHAAGCRAPDCCMW